MKVPIPNDWDGEDWECVQILWPNSPQFWGLLNGLLTLMTRGRYWEENTGSIIDMQAIAWEIFGKNFPYTNCNNEVIPPPSPCDTVCFGGGGLDDCEDEMGGCTLPYGSIEVIGGILMYKTCDGWTPVKGWETGVVTDPPEDEEPVEEEDYGCNKAAGMADLFKPDFDIAVFQMNDKLPRYRAYWLRQALPQYSITNASAALVAKEYAKDPEGNYALLSDADLEQRLRCAWSPAMLDTSTLTIDEFLAMMALTNSEFEPVQTAFINAVVWAIGYSTFSWWAAAFADDTADCTCPGEDPPYEGDMHFTGLLVDSSQPEWFTEMFTENDGKKLFIEWTTPSGTFKGDTLCKLGILMDKPLASFTIKVYPESGSDVPKKEWDTDCGLNPVNWTFLDFGSSWDEVVTSPAPSIQLNEVTHGSGTGTKADVPYKIRKCPSGDVPGVVYRWWLEITHVDGVPV